jgi:2-polyprenyl-6-methoxyphenol hydroxylase-like FAD-dependent oxidoreductase
VALPGRVAVVGGGIGGLTAALALRGVGVEAQVLERAPVLREVGAGIGLWPNAIHVFERLGLGSAVRELGGRHLGGAVATRHGRRLSTQPAEVLEARWDAPTVAVLRAELQTLLAAALPEDALRLGVELTSLRTRHHAVELLLADGEVTHADLVVGADGLRSTVRRCVLGDGTPRYRGYTSWRGFGHRGTAHRLDGATELWGHGERFGLLPGREERLIWYASANSPEGGRAPRGERDELLGRFGGWPEPIPTTLDAMPDDAIVRTDVYDRPVTRRWISRQIALLGDAAHPMTPDLGQGACQAIEDGVILGKMLGPSDDDTATLRAYERKRIERTAPIVKRARMQGKLMQGDNAVLDVVRKNFFRFAPQKQVLKGFQEFLTYEG